jgi:hypothetical protein
MLPSGKYNSPRRKLMFSTWTRPQEGNIYTKLDMDCTNVLKYLETFEKDKRPTVTHICVKTLAEMIKASKD